MVRREVVGAHYGLRDWLAQRITAVIMAVYTALVLTVIFGLPKMDYWQWKVVWQTPIVKFATVLFLHALQLVATQTPRLWSAVLYTVQVSYGSGMSVLLNTIAESLVVPVVAVLATALILGPLTQGCARRERRCASASSTAPRMACS